MGEVGIRIQEAETEGEILTGGFRKGKNNDKDAGLYKKASFFHRTRHKFSIQIIVWTVSERIDLSLVLSMLAKLGKVDWLPERFMIHSDQGCHYTSRDYRKYLSA